MNYELGLQLKNAGFPTSKNTMVGTLIIPKGDGTNWLSPTLEELIESCGKDFFWVMSPRSWEDHNEENRDKWKVHGGTGSARLFRTYGDTPSEAVANLWLALNEK